MEMHGSKRHIKYILALLMNNVLLKIAKVSLLKSWIVRKGSNSCICTQLLILKENLLIDMSKLK